MLQTLHNLLPRLQAYSQKLDHLERLYDQPWVICGAEDSRRVKLIFERNNRLLVAIDGKLSDGRWEYLQVAESLILDFDGSRHLYSQAFVDDALLVLALDGKEEELITLANQRLIGDLDVPKYLEERYLAPARRVAVGGSPNQLSRGPEFEDVAGLGQVKHYYVLKNNRYLKLHGHVYGPTTMASVNDEPVDTVVFALAINRDYAFIRNGIFVDFCYCEQHSLSSGTLSYLKGRMGYNTYNSPVYLNDAPAPDGTYSTGWFSRITVKDGKLIG